MTEDVPTLRLEERAAAVRRDLAELSEQARSGEVDVATAELLEATYRQELAGLEAELGAATSKATISRSPVRVAAGTLIFVLAAAAVVFMAFRALTPGRDPTGSAVASPGIDLESISNEALEAVIAANADHPQIVGMRLALADRYFQVGDFRAALPHYQAVLEDGAGADEEAIALARIGWMFYQSGGEPETAAAYVQESLARVGTYAEAQLYSALISLYGLEDPASALPLLERLDGRSDLPPEVRAVVAEALAQARDGG